MQTKKELIEHWKTIILSVFSAERNCQPQLDELKKQMGKIAEEDFTDQYLTIIANEILSRYDFTENE